MLDRVGGVYNNRCGQKFVYFIVEKDYVRKVNVLERPIRKQCTEVNLEELRSNFSIYRCMHSTGGRSNRLSSGLLDMYYSFDSSHFGRGSFDVGM